MGKGQRHSKNAGVMGSEGLTYHEKRALGFGTVRERVGKESQGNYYDCCLTLQPAVDPVCTPHGYLFSREAILENLLQQRKSNKRKLAAWEKQQEQDEQDAKTVAQLEAEAELLAFDRQNNLGLTRKRAGQEQEQFKERFKRERLEGESVKSVMNIEQNKGQIKEIKSFWHPSKAPESKIRKEKPSMDCVCPASGKPLKMKELVNVKFTSVPEKLKRTLETQHNGNAIPLFMDPISREIFTNSTRLVLLKETGTIMTKKSYETCVKPDGVYEEKRIRDKDVIYLKTGGTGFAARDGEKAEAKRNFPLGPGSGLTDLRGQSHGPRSHGALHCNDRCSLKRGSDCFADPKCIWEPAETVGGFNPLADGNAALVETVCPRISSIAAAAAAEGTLEEFFTSSSSCDAFCEGLPTRNCTDLVAAQLLGGSSVDSSEPFRKLLDSTDLVDVTVSHRDVLSTEGQSEMSLQELFRNYAQCMVCQECNEDPSYFFRDVRIFDMSKEEDILAKCQQAFEQSDNGECRSRCNKDHLHPLDCYKESEYCSCADGSTSDDAKSTDTCAADIQDMICAFKNDVVTDIENTCTRFMDKLNDFDARIKTNPYAVCQGICPNALGDCISTAFNDESATTTDTETFTPFQCAVCERCKNDPSSFESVSTLESCSAALTDLQSSCESMSASPTPMLSEDSMCDLDCAPTDVAKECYSINDEGQCHDNEACRWVGDSHDPLSDVFESSMTSHLLESTCSAMTSLLTSFAKESTKPATEICIATMECDTVSEDICRLFMDGDGEVDHHGRRLLAPPRDNDEESEPYETPTRKLLQLVRASSQRGRQLLQTDEEVLSSLPASELMPAIMTCARCTICQDSEMLDLFHGFAQLGALSEEDIQTECLASEDDESSETYEGQCQPVCSTIPSLNCALYPEYCNCQRWDHHEQQDCRDDKGKPISCGDYGHIGTGSLTCSCHGKSGQSDNPCEYISPGKCSNGCSLDQTMMRMADTLEADFMSDSLKVLDFIVDEAKKMDSIDKVTKEDICTWIGECPCEDDDDDDYNCSSCENCLKDNKVPMVMDILLSDDSRQWNTSFQDFARNITTGRLSSMLCSPDSCLQFADDMNKCEGRDECEWNCHYSGMHHDHEYGHNMTTGISEECYCSPDEFLERACTLVDGKCGGGCVEREDHDTDWEEVVTEQYEQNLIYVSMLTVRYKLEASQKSFDWVDSLTEHDICTWIDNCSPDDECGDDFDEYAVLDYWDNECGQCWSCMTAKPVMQILDLFKYRSQSEWDKGLEEIALIAAENEAAREFCRPTDCDEFSNKPETCSAQDHCHYGCHSAYEGQAESRAQFDEGDEKEEESEGDDGCIDFMLRWAEYMKNPDRFCSRLTDVSAKDCENTMYFLNAMSEFGHFSNFNSRRKLCGIFSDGFPTTATIKRRLGFLFCDPSQQCCGSSPFIEDSGITLPKKQCRKESGCQFIEECVPIKDQCYETALATSRNSADPISCGSHCAFVPSSNPLAFDTVYGRGTCVDLLMEETCKRSGKTGCLNETCMWKPSCSAEVGHDFSCLGADSCCVSTLDGVIEKSQCSSDGCILTKKCVQAIDECGYFHNEWECNFNQGCQFVPLKNEFDRSAGRCISKKDRCEKLPEQACEKSRNCLLIDSCETSTCDPEDQCCGHSKQECRRDPECTHHGECMMRREFDICAHYETESDCKTYEGYCDWNADDSMCKMAYDECASLKDSQKCGFSEKCIFKETCINACGLCSDCIGTFADLQASIDDSTGAFEAQQIFIDFCLASGYDFFTCFRTGQKISRSGGKLAQRPGAICLDLGICQESCKDPETNTAISRCSTTGWLVEDDTTAEDTDSCSSCTSEEYCKLSSSKALCRCNPQTGIDSCKPGGVCVDRCKKFQAKIAEYNSYVESCSSDSNCGEGFKCNQNVVSRTMECSQGSVQITSTNGACVPDSRSISSAKFDNFGSMIEVELNFPALSVQFPAAALFDSATQEKLGRAFCVVYGTFMKIFLRSGARVQPGDVLKLSTQQQVLVDVVNKIPFMNSDTDITVQGCDDCLKPTVLVNYPTRISGGCVSLEPPKAIFDGSFTTDLTGRELTCEWNTDSSNCYRETYDSSTTEACSVLDDAISQETGRILELSPTVVTNLAMKPGFYTMNLTCSNFLNKADSTEIEFEVLGVPMPVISVPREVTYLRSAGLVIPASISQESVCPGDTVVYNWTSDDYGIPGGFLQRKDFRLTGYDSSVAGQTYTLKIQAKLIQPDGTERDGEAAAFVSVTPQSSPVKSHLFGPSGDVVLTDDIVLYTWCEDPDDEENIEGSFDLDYFCVRGFETDAELSFDDSSTQPCEDFGTTTESNVTLSASSLVEDVWYIYTFTCSKSDREHSSTITFRPRSAESLIPTGQVTQLCSGDCPESHDPMKDLKLQIDNLAYEDSTIEWSCPSLTDALTNEQVDGGRFDDFRLTVLGGTLTDVESIDCLVKLTREGHEGEVWIQIDINSAPYCSTEDEFCVVSELISETNEFPDAKYTISCKNFADDQEESLTYSFGCFLPDGQRRVFIKSTQSYYTLSSLDIGNHTCFGCAIDKYNSETCETVEVFVSEPIIGISKEDLGNALDAVTTAENSGDIYAVLQTAGTVVNLVSYASENELVDSVDAEAPSASTRKLLSTSGQDSVSISSVLEPIVTTLGDFDPFDKEAFKPTVTQLAEIASSLDFQDLNTTVITIESGLQASFLADTSYVEDDANQLATDVANILANYATEWTSDYPIVDALPAFMNLQEYAEDLVCMNLALGDNAVIQSSDESTLFSCWKESPSGLNGNIVPVEDVFVSFPSNFSTACGEDCSGTVELHVSIFNNTALHLNFIDSPVPVVGASDIAVISDIISLEVDGVDTASAICEDPGCILTVEVPVSSYNDSKIVACMRIDGATAVGMDDVSGIEFQTGSYSSTNQSVLCEVSNLGDIFVVEFTDPSVLLDATVRSNSGSEDDESTDSEDLKVIIAELRFESLNYAEYEANTDLADALKSQIVYQMTTTSEISWALYEVIELRPGSVIAVVEITLPSSSSQTDIDQLINTIENQPETLFDDAFITTYGVPSLTVTAAPGMEAPAPDEDDDDDNKMMIVIIAVSIIGAIVLGSLALFVCIKAFSRSTASHFDIHGNSYLD
eukprot:g6417.t1